MSEQKEVPAWVLELRQDWESELKDPNPPPSPPGSPTSTSAHVRSHSTGGSDHITTNNNGRGPARLANGALSASHSGMAEQKTKRRSMLSRMFGKPPSRSRSHSHYGVDDASGAAASSITANNPLDMRSISEPSRTSRPE
jgi:hypothetical protein